VSYEVRIRNTMYEVRLELLASQHRNGNRNLRKNGSNAREKKSNNN
jgi:hypothetical protein